MSVPDTAFLQSEKDKRQLRPEFAIMVERGIVNFLSAFVSFENYVVKHIEHQFSKEACQETER